MATECPRAPRALKNDDRAAAAGIPVVAGSIIPYNIATPDQNARMREINAWIAAWRRRCCVCSSWKWGQTPFPNGRGEGNRV